MEIFLKTTPMWSSNLCSCLGNHMCRGPQRFGRRFTRTYSNHTRLWGDRMRRWGRTSTDYDPLSGRPPSTTSHDVKKSGPVAWPASDMRGSGQLIEYLVSHDTPNPVDQKDTLGADRWKNRILLETKQAHTGRWKSLQQWSHEIWKRWFILHTHWIFHRATSYFLIQCTSRIKLSNVWTRLSQAFVYVSEPFFDTSSMDYQILLLST